MATLPLMKRGLAAVVCLPLIALSFLVKKNDSIWVFGAWNGRQYSDNPRYLYEAVGATDSSITPVWISKSPEIVTALKAQGCQAHHWLSPLGIYYSLRAGVAVVSHSADDINPFASYRSKLFKITHGTPMKRMGRDNLSVHPERRSRRIYERVRAFTPQRKAPIAAFVSSEVSKARFESAYRGSDIAVVNSGYPRWKGITDNSGVLWRIVENELKSAPVGAYEKIILYAPTRRADSTFRLSIDEDFVAFVRYANADKYVVVLRPHPSLSLAMNEDVSRQLSELGFLEVDCQRLNDINSALQDVDVLVTDYSSVIYDYCILARPAFLYAPDLDDYITSDTGLYEAYGESEPALKVECLQEVLDPALQQEALSRTLAFKEMHCGGDAMAACAAIVRTIRGRTRRSVGIEEVA
ncbi:CDP-glycerol glycerophosphotransferase family protein [Billgrantia desiderata]|uniref:CDP-glycerol glycerophosphotransferase family protein n=1 Tax=Billgrantia desiderata TaxID=52021 RepID=UPI00089EF6B3|nr:CDP-glycerol glycerophosphotransferase family protein [Halomonas desiderata]SEF55562.1 CDP-glycerol glycerophosphotransferase, TagB/SpsB family [Halomonas desiderata]